VGILFAVAYNPIETTVHALQATSNLLRSFKIVLILIYFEGSFQPVCTTSEANSCKIPSRLVQNGPVLIDSPWPYAM
jgi:hypothetical protein